VAVQQLGGDEAAVLRTLETKPKAVFSRAAMRRDLDRLEHYARQRGLAVDITPLTTLNPEKKTIDVVLELAKRADGTLRF
jgi:outer membrane protein assembly factor BamA